MPPEYHFDPSRLDLSQVVADQEAIRAVIPQRYEMEQLTAIVYVDTEQNIIAGYKDVRPDEFWVRGHMPGNPLMPGVLMCEAAAQLCSFYIVKYSDLLPEGFIGFGGLENVRFRAPVRVGDRLVLVGKAVKLHRRQSIFNVQGFVGSTMVFHADVYGVPLTSAQLKASVGRRRPDVRHPTRLSLEELAPYLLPTPDPPAPIDWAALFGNDHPVELEVGFGKGLFLLNAATAYPDVNFAGVEIERKYQLFTATRLAKRGLRNVRLACADARLFLRDCVATAALRAVHVYFPDPWWKKRHHKRRVFTPEFAEQCQRVLRPGGRLYVATDVEEYFGLMRQALAPLGGLRELPAQAGEDDDRTNFERKAREQGHAVYRAEHERVTPVPDAAEEA